MIYVCLALVAALVVVCVSFTQLLRSQEHAHARREDALVNQLLHLAGRSWQPAPADTWTTPTASTATEDGEWPTWTATPEQEPVFD
jgi:hypothetical protein